jgi:hypothetical protein
MARRSLECDDAVAGMRRYSEGVARVAPNAMPAYEKQRMDKEIARPHLHHPAAIPLMVDH